MASRSPRLARSRAVSRLSHGVGACGGPGAWSSPRGGGQRWGQRGAPPPPLGGLPPGPPAGAHHKRVTGRRARTRPGRAPRRPRPAGTPGRRPGFWGGLTSAAQKRRPCPRVAPAGRRGGLGGSAAGGAPPGPTPGPPRAPLFPHLTCPPLGHPTSSCLRVGYRAASCLPLQPPRGPRPTRAPAPHGPGPAAPRAPSPACPPPRAPAELWERRAQEVAGRRGRRRRAAGRAGGMGAGGGGRRTR